MEHLGLEPLPVEGGWFRQTWRSPLLDGDGRPAGTAIVALFTDDPDGSSAMHRLGTDEIWHFYRGDPLALLLLHPDGSSSQPVLGPGGDVQLVVPAGTWMGGRVVPGGRWSLLGATMAPGFSPAEFEGGSRHALTRGWPRQAEAIAALTRPGSDRPMP